jgi:hypothetical protein
MNVVLKTYNTWSGEQEPEHGCILYLTLDHSGWWFLILHCRDTAVIKSYINISPCVQLRGVDWIEKNPDSFGIHVVNNGSVT